MTAAQVESARRDGRWERLAPAGALGFLLTIAIGALVVGEGTPSSKAPAQEIAAYFAEHRSDHWVAHRRHQPGGEAGHRPSVWLARAGLLLAPVMLLAGVVGLLPPVVFALLALWLVAVAFSLMFRSVGAPVAGRKPRPARFGRTPDGSASGSRENE